MAIKRIAAEAEDNAGSVRRTKAAEARPCSVEREIRPRELRRHPHAHEHPEDGPGHGEHDADLDGVIVVRCLPVIGRFRLLKRGHDQIEESGSEKDDNHAVDPERIRTAEHGHCPSDNQDGKGDGGGALAL